MGTIRVAIASAVAVALLSSPLVQAGDTVRMQDLEARLLALEDRLAASEATVGAQRELLKGAHIQGGSSGYLGETSIWDRVELGGHMAASYLYSFNNPDQDDRFSSQPFNQFNLSHNTFALDAIKFELGLPTNGPGTAGFQFDFLYGENNHILCGDPGTIDVFAAGDSPVADAPTGFAFAGENGDSGVCVQQAYMAYDMSGVVFQFGKWETLLGAEVIDSPENYHIQHGVLFTWAIPLVHTGLLAKGSFTENFGWAAGFSNGFNNVLDSGDSKGVIGQLSWESGPFFTSFSGYYGSEEWKVRLLDGGETVARGSADEDLLILDLVVNFAATDNLNLWGNLDWAQLDRSSNTSLIGPGGTSSPFGASDDTDPSWWAIGGGVAWDFTERAGVAFRGEYFHDEEGARVGLGQDETDYVTATATFKYMLTERLMARAEYRWDKIDTEDDSLRPFPKDDPFALGAIGSSGLVRGGNDTNNVAIVEVSYVFD
jgi:hypothetical protein